MALGQAAAGLRYPCAAVKTLRSHRDQHLSTGQPCAWGGEVSQALWGTRLRAPADHPGGGARSLKEFLVKQSLGVETKAIQRLGTWCVWVSHPIPLTSWRESCLP